MNKPNPRLLDQPVTPGWYWQQTAYNNFRLIGPKPGDCFDFTSFPNLEFGCKVRGINPQQA